MGLSHKALGLWSLAVIGVISIYGGEVCPYLEGLTLSGFALQVVIMVGAVTLLRLATNRFIGDSSRYLFLRELLLFTGASVGLTLFNLIVHGFPFGSGVKIIAAMAGAGYYIGLHQILAVEHNKIHTGTAEDLPNRNRSIVRRFAMLATVTILLLGFSVYLVVVKDLDWLITVPASEKARAVRLITIEVVFILGVMLSVTAVLFISYGRTMRLLFDRHTTALENVTAGKLDTRIPIVSADEFGRMAHYTNTMIKHMNEQERVKEVFGKMVNPTVAELLLKEGRLNGTEQNIAVLMSDIRSFTTIMEGHPASEVVHDLNLYFTEMVRIIREHGGVVDKFIGDGILAVFGLGGKMQPPGRTNGHAGEADAARSAVECSLAMFEAVQSLAGQVRFPLKTGIGVHYGPVIIGRIGAPQRMEFTVIGDTVNTAARLESATKKTATDIIISDAVYSQLGPAQDKWHKLGRLRLKGKAEPVRAWSFTAPSEGSKYSFALSAQKG